MGLKDYVEPSEVIDLPKGQTLTVFGLSFEDLAVLTLEYGPKLTLIYGTVWNHAKSGTLNPETVTQMVQTTLTDCPKLLAHGIALAAREPDAVDAAVRLPPVKQIEAVLKVVSLTLISEAEVKNLVEIVTGGLEKAGDLIPTLMSGNTSEGGSGPTGEK